MIFKNVAGQGTYLYAVDSSTNEPKTGDAANITGRYSLDGGADAAAAGAVVEIARGVYWLPLAQAETNGAAFVYSGTSTTADVVIEPVIGFTVPDDGTLDGFKADVAGLSTFDPATDTVARVTLVDTTTSNTDMRGTDNAATPGDEMALTAPAITAIDTELSATHGAGSWESAGVATGAQIVVITVNDTLGFPVPSASVVVRNNADNATLGFYVTNNNGQITANLDNSPAGQPYKVRLGKVGYMFTIPENLTVLGDTNQTYTGAFVDPGVPVAGLQTLSGNIKLLTGEAEPNATVRAVIASMPQHVDVSVLSNVVSEAETDSNGNFSLYLIKGASVTLYISQDVNGRRFWQKTITVTDDNNRNIVEY